MLDPKKMVLTILTLSKVQQALFTLKSCLIPKIISIEPSSHPCITDGVAIQGRQLHL